MERIYQKTPLNEIPWNIENPPAVLTKLVESGEVKPCKTIDLGCGTGNYSIYLASVGFDVTGIDISPTAIKIAKQNAKKKKVKCNFLVADALYCMDDLKGTFHFAYDWELLHHIFPEQRKKYIKNIYELLNHKAYYLSVSFNENDTVFSGSGKYRKTRLGTLLYFSSQNELKELLEPYFKIKELETMEIKGTPKPHIINYAFMQRRNGLKCSE